MRSKNAVIVHVGKTVSKVSLWSSAGTLLDGQQHIAPPHATGGIRRLDAEGIGAWLLEALTQYADENVGTIIPIAHGATLAAINADGLAFAPLDHDEPLPKDIAAAYRNDRDASAPTRSPRTSGGQDLGARLYWMEQITPNATEGATILPWAQYWGWFLSGRAATEVTGLGSHGDLWCADTGRYSPLALSRGWARKFAPIMSAYEPLGFIRPELAKRSGLPRITRILTGMSDRHAALLAARAFAEIGMSDATLITTDNQPVAMRIVSDPLCADGYPVQRNCFLEVDPYDRPVAAARFKATRQWGSAGNLGDFAAPARPDPEHETSKTESGQRVDGLNAALEADAALSTIGSRTRLLVSGDLADLDDFAPALAALRPDMKVYTAPSVDLVALGAMRLIDRKFALGAALRPADALSDDIRACRRDWQDAKARTGLFRAWSNHRDTRNARRPAISL
ncbi:carbohydrate kinase [Sphingopyxis sp.]|uniref:carbohydrate kinase n=1 Tax=Sphingopyxis sp. TaxID=1908224 RepID=UPI002DE6E71D|nr:carbohydrate kinase [Sphingopyxis sp.]